MKYFLHNQVLTILRLIILGLLIFPFYASAETVPEPDGFRMEKYRAPVPSTLEGAKVIGIEEAYKMWKDGNAKFVDVMRHEPKPKNLPEGTIWREKPRITIKGAIWLANVGYGKIAAETDQYFQNGLNKVTNGNLDAPIVIYCLRNCWMSWNAAKRAVEYGYTNVFWYPDGMDGWEENSYPSESIHAE